MFRIIKRQLKEYITLLTVIALTAAALPAVSYGTVSSASNITIATMSISGSLLQQSLSAFKKAQDNTAAPHSKDYERTVSLAVKDTANVILKNVPTPLPGSIYGDWAVIGLVRSGITLPDGYTQKYISTVNKHVKELNGILSTRKYSEYSRTVLGLTACGADPSDISGFNLLTPLGDYENTVRQGLSGAVWALIALDSADYRMPVCKEASVQASREMYLEYILERQLPDGGFAISGENADADITAMCLYALSDYSSNVDVSASCSRAVSCLSLLQEGNGGFSSYGASNAESMSQVIIALCKHGISVDGSDERFVKNGLTIIDALMSHYLPERGFSHTLADGNSIPDEFSTEQALLALISTQRERQHLSPVYLFT